MTAPHIITPHLTAPLYRTSYFNTAPRRTCFWDSGKYNVPSKCPEGRKRMVILLHSRQTPPVQCRLPGPRSNECKTNRRNFSFLIIENKIPQLLKIFSAVLVHI